MSTNERPEVPDDVTVRRAEVEARTECRHCWHSESDAAADNHDAKCCRCGVRSTPTIGAEGSN